MSDDNYRLVAIRLEVSVRASTKVGYVLGLEEALTFGGHAAGICYMPDDFEAILNEPSDKTIARVRSTLVGGHHSVYDHPAYSLGLAGIPKLLAMVLNNERMYTTSEKSARYTQMEMVGREKDLYDKWLTVFVGRISDEYPDFDQRKALKLAQENARYLISVFTPTTMQYTVSLRQLNYLLHRLRKFIAVDHAGDALLEGLKPSMVEFVDQLHFLEVEDLTDEAKGGTLSLFDSRESRTEYFGETYSISYLGSFAQLAQAHRHRTLDYKMLLPDDSQFYVPPIIGEDADLATEWLRDISSVADHFPQGMMVSIRERGTHEHFILKMNERLCSSAQLEISRQTNATLVKYIAATSDTEPQIHDELRRFRSGSRCGAGYPCNSRCEWQTRQLQRKV